MKEKIVVHIGYPKTATSFLQEKVFLELHKQEKINFLGRYKDNSKFNKVLSLCMQDSLSDKDLKRGSKDFIRELKPNTINLISEEGICWLPSVYGYGLFNFMKNLSIVLKDYDVTIFLSLREITSWTFSTYTELYKWHYHSVEGYQTYNQYIDMLFRKPDNLEFEFLFLSKVLKSIGTHFNRIEFLFFQDLEHDKSNYAKDLSHLLNVETSNILYLLNNDKSNIGTYTSTGKKAKKVYFGDYLSSLQRRAAFKYDFLRVLSRINTLRSLYLFVIKVFNNINIDKDIYFDDINDSRKLELRKHLLDINTLGKYMSDQEKLKKIHKL